VGAPPIADVIEWAIARKVAGVLIDTADKSGGDLLSWCGDLLPAFVAQVRAGGCFIALAGSVREATLPRLLRFEPDIIAVRGAAFAEHDRNAAIDVERVRQLKAIIAEQSVRTAVHAG